MKTGAGAVLRGTAGFPLCRAVRYTLQGSLCLLHKIALNKNPSLGEIAVNHEFHRCFETSREGPRRGIQTGVNRQSKASDLFHVSRHIREHDLARLILRRQLLRGTQRSGA